MSIKDWAVGQLATIHRPDGTQESTKVVAVGRRYVTVRAGKYITKFDASKDPPTWLGQITKTTYTLHTRGRTA